MLLLALGGEASKARMDLLELGRPPGKLRLTGEQIVPAKSKCHSNICKAACKRCREVSSTKVKDGKAAWGAGGCTRRILFPFARAGCVSFSLLLTCVVFPPPTVDLGRGSFHKTKANLRFS